MKLTNTIRDAFIRAAMHDVPSIDYRQQADDLAQKAMKAIFAKDFPRIDMAKVADWLQPKGVSMPGALGNLYQPAPSSVCLKKDVKVWAALEALSAKHDAQEAVRAELRRKLRAVAYSVNTRKALVDALPEFAKYLPADQAEASRQLPVVADVVAEFAKAGWPKGKKPTAARAV